MKPPKINQLAPEDTRKQNFIATKEVKLHSKLVADILITVQYTYDPGLCKCSNAIITLEHTGWGIRALRYNPDLDVKVSYIG